MVTLARRRSRKPALSLNGSTAGLRAALYIRVSSEEQVQGYSLDAQERAAEQYCSLHGWEIVTRYRDEGKSARTDDLSKRPAFAQMLDDAETGRFDVLICHKLDRFARNLRVCLETLERLEAADVAFVSISEQVDYSTPIGKMFLANLATLAQFYSDNLSWETRKGKTERKRQGLYNGLLPFGVSTNAAGIPVLDNTPLSCEIATRREIIPAEGLHLAFELAAAGQTDREIARALNAAGYLTSGNRGQNPFTKDSVRVVLNNRFYLGELPDEEGGWLPGKHGTLIEPALFDRAQQQRAANLRAPRRVQTSTRSPWALSGIAVCGHCGRPLTACGHAGAKRRVQCSGRVQGNGCDAPTFFATGVVDQIGQVLQHFTVPAADQAALVDAWRRSQRHHTDTTKQRRQLERRLVRLRELYLDGDLDRASYQEQRSTLNAELAALPVETSGSVDAGNRLVAYLADIASAWQAATDEERNALARQLFSETIIANQTAVAVVPRPEMCPFFEYWERQQGDEITQGRKRRASVTQLHSATWCNRHRRANGMPPGWQVRPCIIPDEAPMQALRG